MKPARSSYHRALTGRAYLAIAAVAFGILLAPWLALGGWKPKKTPAVPAGPPEDLYPVQMTADLGDDEATVPRVLTFPADHPGGHYMISIVVNGEAQHVVSFHVGAGEQFEIQCTRKPTP